MNTMNTMNTLTFDTLTFDTLTPSGDGNIRPVEIDGHVWEATFWGYSFRNLRRELPAGCAQVMECNQGFRLEVNLPCEARTPIKYSLQYQTLEAAVAAAGTFSWDVRDHAGVSWYQTGASCWGAILGDGDYAEVIQNDHGFVIRRRISPRWGESYEIFVNRYDCADSTNMAVKTFEEAVAIALTLPSYLSALATAQPKQ